MNLRVISASYRSALGRAHLELGNGDAIAGAGASPALGFSQRYVELKLGRRQGVRAHVRLQAYPFSYFGGTLDCIQNFLDLYRIVKIGVELFSTGQRGKKVSQSRDEGMFVTYGMAGLPEVFGIRMVGAGDQHASFALQIWRLGRVIKHQPIHVLEIKTQHSLGAMDFENVAIAAAHPVAGGFEASDAAVGEVNQK